jgi:hypothetical protein
MLEMAMRTGRTPETLEEQKERLVQEAQTKRDAEAANEAAIDRMISRNIKQHGP